MELLQKIICKPDLNLSGRTFFREAVRGIIYQDRKLLMVHSSVNGEYKFPGGGREDDEPLHTTLRREILEECGARLKEVLGEFGKVIEYDNPLEKDFDLFKMTSYYYICRVEPEIDFLSQRLDAYERDLGFSPIWVDIDTALKTDLEILASANTTTPRWTKREAYILGLIKEQTENGGNPLFT